MGCASSTPMVATAGSEFLKTASHVATDASKSAESAVHDAADAVGKTIDNAKEMVGAKVNDVAHEIGNVIKDKTEDLEEVKKSIFEKLHLNDNKSHHMEQISEIASATLIEGNISKPPTPTAPDADSLRTSTPEPEIETALANVGESNPPTPKPTLSELEELNAEVHELMENQKKEMMAFPMQEASATIEKVTNSAPVAPAGETEQRRPRTTEWEKLADQLASSQKYLPNINGFGRTGRFVPHSQPHVQNTGYKPPFLKNRIQREENRLSGPTHSNGFTSPFHSTESSPSSFPRRGLPNHPTASNVRKYQKEFASLVSENGKFGNTKNLNKNKTKHSIGRKFDYNPQRSRVNLPFSSGARTLSRISSPKHKNQGNNWSSLRSSARQTRSHASESPVRNAIHSYSRTVTPIHSKKNLNSAKHSPIKSSSKISLTQSSDSGSSDDVVIKSTFSSTTSTSPMKISLNHIADVKTRLENHKPSINVISDHCRNGSALKNTSSFLASPRISPFASRRSSNATDLFDKENKFKPDLSSVKESRLPFVTSPYKVRERCLVCYNKYRVK